MTAKFTMFTFLYMLVHRKATYFAKSTSLVGTVHYLDMCDHRYVEMIVNQYNRLKTVHNHGNMPPFYIYMKEKKYKLITDKGIGV